MARPVRIRGRRTIVQMLTVARLEPQSPIASAIGQATLRAAQPCTESA